MRTVATRLSLPGLTPLLFLALLAVACTPSRGGGRGTGSEGEGEGSSEGEGEGPAEGEGEGPAEGEGELPPVCADRCDCRSPLICEVETGDCIESPPVCNGHAECPCGQLCKLGACADGCENNSDCGRQMICKPIGNDRNACFHACGAAYPCPADQDYDCLEGACIPRVRQCAACEEDTDCGGTPDLCYDFGDIGMFCTKDCSLDPNSCGEGFRCRDLNREMPGGHVDQVRQCVPANRDCASVCTFIGCDDPEKPHCNRLTGVCAKTFGPCDPCESHDECGEGLCKGYRPGFHCLLPCPNGVRDCGDPHYWRCDVQGQGAWCVPITGTCDRCDGVRCCKDAPHCHEGSGECVECLADLDCPDGEKCGPNTNRCLYPHLACRARDPENPDQELCTIEAPYCYEDYCVECLGNADCDCPADSPACNPVCYHFQCMGDDFCERVTCPDGTNCIPEARRCVEGGRCDSDADCGGCRLCDQARQMCYNADGACFHNGDCPSGLVCALDLHLCQGCDTHDMCRRRQMCVPTGDGRKVCRQA